MKNNSLKNLGISVDTKTNETKFRRFGNSYSVTDLIKISSRYNTFELPIAGVDISINPWGDFNIKHFAYHMNRVLTSNLDYPIILDDSGFICDGWHRLVKAIIDGKETIKAIRLPLMPEPIESNTEES
jgi:hypothetical protein